MSGFREKGWMVIDLENQELVLEARAALERELHTQTGRRCPLEEYHTLGVDDDQHSELQAQMTQFFRMHRFGPRIIASELPFFRRFLGLDLLVQASPYLRMTRPYKPQDNIGYHRDTFYGGSPYELSVLVPYVDVPSESALGVLSGSHTEPEGAFPTVQITNSDTGVKKGSVKHQMGFLYAPKMMDPAIEEKIEPVPLKVGQALIFMLSIVHGSVVNRGPITRWSSDIRILNAFAPVDLSARPTYYEPLCESEVTYASKVYYGEKRRETVELESCR